MLKKEKDPFLFWIICLVVFVHGLGVSYLILAESIPSSALKDKKLVVKAIKLHPPTQSPGLQQKIVSEEIAARWSPPPVKEPLADPPLPPPPQPAALPTPLPSSPQPAALPTPKANLAKKKSPAKPQPKKQPVKKEANSSTAAERKKKLVQQANESLAKIGQKSNNTEPSPKKSAQVPERIEKLSFVGVQSLETATSSFDNGYPSELGVHLRALLQLPEIGNVEVELVVNRLGGVEKLTIISSQNKRNSDYIAKKLPTLSLPRFGENFSGEKSHAFHITLTNE